jgi:DUF971 family protein
LESNRIRPDRSVGQFRPWYFFLNHCNHRHIGVSNTLRQPSVRSQAARYRVCDTEFVAAAADPKSVIVNLTTGTGLDIEWKDGHRSHYSFPFLRDACPCALCDEARSKSHQQPGEPPKLAAGALPMFKPAVKATSADGVGKYAIKFHFNDDHELGIYSWQFLRDWCPCEECKAARVTQV